MPASYDHKFQGLIVEIEGVYFHKKSHEISDGIDLNDFNNKL